MNTWQERLALLKYKGGIKAAVFWLVRTLCRIEIHFFYAINLTQQQASLSRSSSKNPRRKSFQFISLNSAQDIVMYPHELIEQISSQSGRNVAQLIHDNAGVYAFIDGIHAISQTNISCSPAIRVDSPTELDIYLTHGDVFLGYLFTYPHYRGTGTAASLLEAVCEDVKRRGYSRIVTHIRSTNVASLNTFNKCGWSRIGWILTSTNGHLLSTYCLRKAGITILATR